jgi:hypothetical protein
LVIHLNISCSVHTDFMRFLLTMQRQRVQSANHSQRILRMAVVDEAPA